jgi:hypothetical protein
VTEKATTGTLTNCIFYFFIAVKFKNTLHKKVSIRNLNFVTKVTKKLNFFSMQTFFVAEQLKIANIYLKKPMKGIG